MEEYTQVLPVIKGNWASVSRISDGTSTNVLVGGGVDVGTGVPTEVTVGSVSGDSVAVAIRPVLPYRCTRSSQNENEGT